MSFDLLQDDLDNRLYGTYGRLPEQTLKLSMILAALNWPENTSAPVITRALMTRALIIAESWRASAHRAIEELATTEAHSLYDRILRAVAIGEPAGATVRDVFQHNRDLDVTRIALAIEDMLELGLLTQEESKGRPGRPTTKYHVAKDE